MNQLYTPARPKFLTALIDWDASDIRMVLLNNNYVFDINHEFLSDIPAADRIAVSDVPNESSAQGYARGGAAQFLSLTSSEEVTYVALYVETGDENTSDLVAYFDTADGIPFLPEGNDYFIAQDILFGGFFRL